jgi:hypothetical protein
MEKGQKWRPVTLEDVNVILAGMQEEEGGVGEQAKGHAVVGG